MAEDGKRAAKGPAIDAEELFNQGEDSSIESGDSSATTSISSSILSYTYANGRRYHSDRFSKADYFLPNDEDEQGRLDLYHHIFLLLKGGKLYTAPLDNPQMVLDIGTGTGIWAIDFATEHPEAIVIGTDISPIQPTWVPANVKFEVDDAEDDWTFPNNYFDYVHMRSLSGSIADWPKLLTQAYDALKPGGYIEFQDYSCEFFLHDGTPLIGINERHPISTYMHHITQVAAKNGRELPIARKAKSLLERAGFVDIVESIEIWPLGKWPKDERLKELGVWGKLGCIEAAHPFVLSLLAKEGWPLKDIEKLADDLITSLSKPWGKYYSQGWFVYGRKPLGKEVKH